MTEPTESQPGASVHRAVDWVSLLSRLSVRLSSSLEVASVLEEVVVGACLLTDARYGAIGIFDRSGAIAQFITHGLSDQQRRRIGDLPKGQGILGLLHRLQQPLRIADLTAHPDRSGFPPHHPPMRSFVGTPVRYGDVDLGTIYLTEKAGGGPFTAQDEQVLSLFANQAAMALHNAQLHEQVRAERRRWMPSGPGWRTCPAVRPAQQRW